jgi:hypothetical protein
MLPGVLAPAVAATGSARTPDLVTGSAYLVAPANLIDGRYYESFPGTADFGLTIDGALALAATGDDNAALREIVAFLDDEGKDPSGRTVNDWTGIGTSYASGGAIGKEALLAEVVGDNPRDFGGHNLIAALDASVCTRPSKGANTSCPAAGSYLNDTSVFDQTLGVMAQLRAGQVSAAAAPIAYLESLQSADGSFPSLIPPSGGPDVDSTAMAVMALALASGQRATAAVRAGLTWIASQQERNGGFPSGGAESINSTGLAIQAMTLRAAASKARIAAARAFLAREQNSNGGFDADAGQHGSNLRASTQAVGGAVGTSFGTLRRHLSRPAAKPGQGGTGQAGGHNNDGRVNARTGRPSSNRHAATQTPGASVTTPAARASLAAPRRHRAGIVAATGYRSHPTSAAWMAWTALPAIALALAAVILGLVLTWRRPRRPPVQLPPVLESAVQLPPVLEPAALQPPAPRSPAEPQPLAEPLPSLAADRVRS